MSNLAQVDRRRVAGGIVAIGVFGWLAWWLLTKEAKAATKPAPRIPQPVSSIEYTIRAGDSLTKLAKDHLGNEYWFAWIFDLNRATRGGSFADSPPDPNRIRAGSNIILPTSTQGVPSHIEQDYKARFAALQSRYKAGCKASVSHSCTDATVLRQSSL